MAHTLLVTGSIGFDTVTTPHGHVENVIGGSAVYFSFAAGHYTRVRLVGVVGEDFPPAFRDQLASGNIDLSGLEVRRGSKTFRWTGKFVDDMSQAETLDIHVNVLAESGPKVPDAFADSDLVFLANTHPVRQRELLAQVRRPRLSLCDTVDHWIINERDALVETLKLVSGVILNDAEARLLTGETNLITAGREILRYGPQFVAIKKAAHGALLLSPDGITQVPAYPTEEVKDPTGAGDSFAGGILGYLATQDRLDTAALRRAVVRGVVLASFTIEDFSMRRITSVTRKEIDARIEEMLAMLRIE